MEKLVLTKRIASSFHGQSFFSRVVSYLSDFIFPLLSPNGHVRFQKDAGKTKLLEKTMPADDTSSETIGTCPLELSSGDVSNELLIRSQLGD